MSDWRDSTALKMTAIVAVAATLITTMKECNVYNAQGRPCEPKSAIVTAATTIDCAGNCVVSTEINNTTPATWTVSCNPKEK